MGVLYRCVVDFAVPALGLAARNLGFRGDGLRLVVVMGLQHAADSLEKQWLVGQLGLCTELRRFGLGHWGCRDAGGEMPADKIILLALLYSLVPTAS